MNPTDKYKTLFSAFLKFHGAYQKFLRNAGINSLDDYDHVFRQNHAKNWIDISFVWRNQPEGDRFWYTLHRKWEHIIYTKTPDNKLVSRINT